MSLPAGGNVNTQSSFAPSSAAAASFASSSPTTTTTTKGGGGGREAGQQHDDDDHLGSTQLSSKSSEPRQQDDDDDDVLNVNSRGIGLFLRYQGQALADCDARIRQQDALLREYLALRDRLTTLADQPRYNPAVIPLGPHAVVRGELVHTNEVLVFLGDNYFAERSAKQACEIASRRIAAVERNLAKLTEERNLIQGKMDMLANLVQTQSLEDNNNMVEIREALEEEDPSSHHKHNQHSQPGAAVASRFSEPDKSPRLATDEEIMNRLDQLQDEELEQEEDGSGEMAEKASPGDSSSIDADMVDYEDIGPKRPVPLPTARPRRSSLPSLSDGVRKKERKSVSFAPFQGRVPEREGQDNPLFRQALQMMLASGKFKSMDEGSMDSDELSLPNYRAMSAESALPRLKKQANIVMESMDVDESDAHGGDAVTPMVDSDEIIERNIGTTDCRTDPSSSSFPASSAAAPDAAATSSPKPVSRFKASRQK
ncbi:putative Unconventional prefoldin RPB5 interactor [Hypsibius exemplaris]|uniref:Unconventional prefoldin RPB5 interactor n=1 Tax=Hypsibius exemplaris TaxID=2072580 RepID=A0A1W0X936_HYPEX|nr:putative Unconventional prefoldin RPB5 interactor [Hypsibius exemplaris]